MLGRLRAAARSVLPPKLLHLYRVVRHTTLWPTEPELVTARQFLSPKTVAVDVGANFGLFTSVLARHAKSVIAFEPNRACARYLTRVLPPNCDVIAKAVSDAIGMTTLRMPLEEGVALEALATIEGANHFDGIAAAEFVSQPVETTTLDHVLLGQRQEGGRVSFINIDAEGHEFAVLRGGQGLLVSDRPVLLIEIEYRHGSPVQEIFEWLQKRRYVARALIEGTSLEYIDPVTLGRLQDGQRLARRIAGDRRSGYVNNIFFLPEP